MFASKNARPASDPRIFKKPQASTVFFIFYFYIFYFKFIHCFNSKIITVPKYPAGDIPGIEHGRIFTGRFSIWESGVHRVPMGAIASNMTDGN